MRKVKLGEHSAHMHPTCYMHQIALAIGSFWCLDERVLIIFPGRAALAVSSSIAHLKDLGKGNYKGQNLVVFMHAWQLRKGSSTCYNHQAPRTLFFLHSAHLQYKKVFPLA